MAHRLNGPVIQIVWYSGKRDKPRFYFMRLRISKTISRQHRSIRQNGEYRFATAGVMRVGKYSAAIVFIVALMVSTIAGCSIARLIPDGKHDTKKSYHASHGMSIQYPEVKQCETPTLLKAQQTTVPLTMQDPANLPTLELSLQEAVNLAITSSPVLRTVGASQDVRLAVQGVATVYDPALTASSPQFGAEAALSAFDAQYAQQLFWSSVDRPNNIAPNGITSVFTPTVSLAKNAAFNAELSKTTAMGGSYALRHIVNYSRSNQPFRAFESAFDGWVEAEWRQPLAQGSGVTYNRIAGPGALPGQYNGVLIARVNEDISLVDFEVSVIQVVTDVEQKYWNLVTAYRRLDTAVRGRELARRTWEYNKKRLEVGAGRLDDEAQARSQYYNFEAQVQAELAGSNGLYETEQQLRYMVGMVATDGRLLRPTTEPIDVRVTFDWESALAQALERRVEIRKQKFQVKRRDMELVAARLNYKPRVDFVSQYRWYGLGNHLIGNKDGALDNMYGEITGGNYQEWQAGVDLRFPVGLRAAGLAIANAKLNVKRERAILAETEFLISHNLSNAARQVTTTHELLETNYDRLIADLNQVDVLDARYRIGSDNIRDLLLAQRQLVNSATEFYSSLSRYNLAIRDFHREKGSLLAYNNVQLAEGPWATGAKYDAYRTGRFLRPSFLPGTKKVPAPLTRGPFNPSAKQNTSAPVSHGAEAIQEMPFSTDEDSASPSEQVPVGNRKSASSQKSVPEAGDGSAGASQKSSADVMSGAASGSASLESDGEIPLPELPVPTE
ncbi:TolC family protein [Rubripirellula sp.]|nr:TolC family protein [Rubripirellula sp.]MDB4749378.1 TolC family protein [Rubripirellula sp.]